MSSSARGGKYARFSTVLSLEACWLLVAFLTPSLFNPASLRTYEAEKIALVRSIALVMLALWALEALWRRGDGPHPDPLPGGEGISPLSASPRPRVSASSPPISPSPRGAVHPSPPSPVGKGAGGLGRPPVPFLLPVAALMGAYLLAALLSDLPGASLLGSYRRQFGVVTHLAYAAVFLATAVHLRSEAQVRRLLLAIALGTVIPTLYALAQRLGLDPMPSDVDISARVMGTLGQPTYLGAYLAGALPATLFLAMRARSGRGRFLLAGLIAAQAAALLFSQSRGAWLGAAAGTGTLLLFGGTARPWIRRVGLRKTAAASLAALALVVLANLPGTEIHRAALTVPYLGRLASLADFDSGSGGVRVLIWQAVPALVAERPLFGHGPELMGHAFERHYPPALARAENRTATADYPHNLLLQPLVSAGLVGLAAYLWLLVAVARGAVLGSEFSVLSSGFWPSPRPSPKGRGGSPVSPSARLIPSSPPSPAGKGAGGKGPKGPGGLGRLPAVSGLVALLVEGMVGVPSAAPYLLFWLYLAVVSWTVREGQVAEVAVAGGGASAERGRQTRGRRSRAVRPGGKRAAGRTAVGGAGWAAMGASVALMAVAGAAILRLNVLPVAADVIAARASDLAARDRFQEAEGAFRQALELAPDPEYYLLLGQMATRAAVVSPAPRAEGWLRKGEEALAAAQQLDPLDLDVALAQGKLHQVAAGALGRAERLLQAQDAFGRALDLSPRRTYVRNRYGAVLAARGEHEEALEQYRRSLELDPDYAATHGFLADSLVALGRLDEAVGSYLEAKRLDPALVLVRINLGELYLRLGRLGEAIGEYEAAVGLAPEDRGLRARLSALRGPSGSGPAGPAGQQSPPLK